MTLNFSEIFKRLLASLRRFITPAPFLPPFRSGEHRHGIGNRFVSNQLELFVKKLGGSLVAQRIRWWFGFISIKKEADKPPTDAQQLRDASDVIFPYRWWQRTKECSLVNKIEGARSKVVSEEIAEDDLVFQCAERILRLIDGHWRKIDRRDLMPGFVKCPDHLKIRTGARN